MNMTRLSIESCMLEVVQGNIVDQVVDAIVNAANSQLAGGGGVDGAIHHHGGPDIQMETRQRYPAGCPTGSAVISGAGRLKAKYVIHAVGPVWRGGDQGEPDLLARAYRRSLELAAGHECQSVALPAISTGVYGYPLEPGARIALSATLDFLKLHGTPRLVRFVLFSEDAYRTFDHVLQELHRLQRSETPAE